jgi:hypothetical protein
MTTAMNLYQPGYWQGKCVKRFLPYLKQIGFVRRKLGANQHYYKLTDELNELLYRLFKVKKIEFSLFCGTPSVHQKITIQLSIGRNILGYCKVSDQSEIKTFFFYEQQILAMLEEKGVEQIPKCYYCGILKEGINIFVQSTIKTNSSKTLHEWDNRHWDFLTQLYTKTKQILQFEQTDFCRTLNRLSSLIKHLSPQDAFIVASAIERVNNQYDSKVVTFSAYHGDFTPWNIFVEKGELFIFDWEYSERTFPPFLDSFHFLTQTGIFEKKMNAEEIYKTYCKTKSEFQRYIKNPDFGYLCYLLTTLSFYIDRDKGMINGNLEKNIDCWMQLIDKLTIQYHEF